MNGQLQECVRGAIVTGIRARRTNREIADFNNLSVNTMNSFARKYHNFIEEGGQDEDFDIKRKQHRHRSDAHSMEIVEKVQEAINDNPRRFMRKLAEELEVSEWLIRKIIKEDILYR
jgi:NADH:ubiquinone oxidoreductase subunit E